MVGKVSTGVMENGEDKDGGWEFKSWRKKGHGSFETKEEKGEKRVDPGYDPTPNVEDKVEEALERDISIAPASCGPGS